MATARHTSQHYQTHPRRRNNPTNIYGVSAAPGSSKNADVLHITSLRQRGASGDEGGETSDENMTFKEHAQRTAAAEILRSDEALVWHARAMNETVAQARLYFRKILADCNPDSPPAELSEAGWRDSAGGHGPSPAPAPSATSSPRLRSLNAAAAAAAAAVSTVTSSSRSPNAVVGRKRRVAGHASLEGSASPTASPRRAASGQHQHLGSPSSSAGTPRQKKRRAAAGETRTRT